MTILKKIKGWIKKEDGLFSERISSEETHKINKDPFHCHYCNTSFPEQNPEYRYCVDKDFYFQKHFIECYKKSVKSVPQMRRDADLIELLNILNSRREEGGFSPPHTTRFIKTIFSAKELYLIFKTNLNLRKLISVPDIGLVQTLWYALDLEGLKEEHDHPYINEELFKNVFVQHGLICIDKNNVNIPQYALTHKGIELKQLLLKKTQVDKKFIKEVFFKDKVNPINNYELYANPHNIRILEFMDDRPLMFEEELKLLRIIEKEIYDKEIPEKFKQNSRLNYSLRSMWRYRSG